MRSTTLVTTILALAQVALVLPAYAYSNCFEPPEPRCIDAYGTFDNDFSFNSCRREVERYADEMPRYVNCLIDEANQAQRDASIKVDALIEKFNCKARRETFCN